MNTDDVLLLSQIIDRLTIIFRLITQQVFYKYISVL